MYMYVYTMAFVPLQRMKSPEMADFCATFGGIYSFGGIWLNLFIWQILAECKQTFGTIGWEIAICYQYLKNKQFPLKSTNICQITINK